MNVNKKIACIIVTYNRLELLKRCVKSIEDQSCIFFDTIIVNNGSTDGTENWLETKTNSIYVINQENQGGAGGFYAGMKYAYKNGYEWLWLMDDDGIADKYQLRELLFAAEKNHLYYLNALVCNINNPEKLTFGLKSKYINLESKGEAQQQTLVFNCINPFNGTFIHRTVIDKIGFIKKEMFIWGDEQEYMFRAIKNGFQLATVTSAIHYHPLPTWSVKQVFPFCKKYIIAEPPSNRMRIYFRNLGYLQIRYYTFRNIMRSVILYPLYFFRKMQMKKVILFWIYYIRGILGIFNIKENK